MLLVLICWVLPLFAFVLGTVVAAFGESEEIVELQESVEFWRSAYYEVAKEES